MLGVDPAATPNIPLFFTAWLKKTKWLCEDAFCSSQALQFGYLYVPVAVLPGGQSRDCLLCFEATLPENVSLTQVKTTVIMLSVEEITLIVNT